MHMSADVCKWLHAHEYRCLEKSEKSDPLGAEVLGSCELLDMGAGNQTQVLLLNQSVLFSPLWFSALGFLCVALAVLELAL